MFCLGIVSAYNFLKEAYPCAIVSGYFKDAQSLPLNREKKEEEEEEDWSDLFAVTFSATRCLTLIFSVLNSPFHISCVFQSTF